jgi:FkbM family methyltransferase
MKILGRPPRNIVSAFWKLPMYFLAFCRCVLLFRRPINIIWHYIKRQNPSNKCVELRDGLIIHLSSDNSDIVTVFLIFCRHDYGLITPGCVVVDVGANIGIFALYAARSGAISVRAYEPAKESFEVFKINIQKNGFEDVIFPYQVAVVGRPSPSILFPRQSSVFNRIVKCESSEVGSHVIVPSLVFSEVVVNLPSPNMIKMDCEGGEYDIILNSSVDVFDHIEEIRIEYHEGPRQDLIAYFKKLDFIFLQSVDEGERGGYLWLGRVSR